MGTRRDFLQETAALGLGFWAAGGVSAAPRRSANDAIRFGCIAVGGKGSSDTDDCGKVGDVVALCDIDDNTLNQKAKKFPQAAKFNDFRKLFDEMGKSIDAVSVSGPDHMHAAASLMAMRMGKHVYCQKPLTRTVYEARLLKTTALQYKVATQMGNQGTASNGLRQAVEIVHSGAIGPIKEVHVWTNRPVWSQAPDIVARPPKVDPVPKHVHWDLWLGPAMWRPYANGVYHAFEWRGWWDFGTGAMGDMACHTANMAFMAAKLGHPTRAEAKSGPINAETFPEWAKITYDFPARGDLPPCKLFWYEGRIGGRNNKTGKRSLPPQELLAKVLRQGEKLSGSGSLLVGEKGILFSPDDYGEKFRLLPEPDFAGYQPPTPTLPRNGKSDLGMKQEWVEAMRGGRPAMSNFDYSAQLTESMLVGNLALRLQKPIEWDAENMKATNAPEADPFIKPEYRRGWVLDS